MNNKLTRRFARILSGTLMLATALSVFPAQVFAVNTQIRQEININDAYDYAPSGSYATSSEIANLDATQYTSGTYYFEVVASTTSAVNATVSLVNATSSAVITSVTVNGTSYARYRSTSFVPPNVATDYAVKLGNEAVGKGIIASRIIVIQNAASITNTMTQIEIGNNEQYSSTATSTFSAPKYWYYDASAWDGSPTFYAEVDFQALRGVASSTTYATAGTFTVKLPAGTASTSVGLWGGGGAGGGGPTSTGGSGGAGGQFASSTLVATTTVHSLTVAATKAGGSGVAGGQGATTTWDGTLVRAGGGNGGAIGISGNQASTTGNSVGCIGQICFAGGNGGGGAVAYGAGGGGGAGTSGVGGNATTSGNAGSGTAVGGGYGGAKKTSSGTTGNAGSNFGGGGSGGFRTTGTSTGGSGAQGEALITDYIATTTISLQEDDGQFGNWTTKATIVGNASTTEGLPTRVRSAAFTPNDGHHYRIAFAANDSRDNFAIYNAKIIVDQTSPNLLQPQYLLANTKLKSGTGLQNYLTSWDSTEWANTSNTYTQQVDSAASSASVVEVDTSGGAQVTGSVVSSPKNSATSTAMTMPATGNLDTKATTNNNDIYGTRIIVDVTPPIVKPTVTTQSASSVGQTGATLNGTITVTGWQNATTRGFAWGTNANLSGGDTATTTDPGSWGVGAFTNTSLTLTCNTTYYARAYATNSAGTGLGAISSSFTTTACMPTVTTQSASSVTATTSTLNGTITATGGSNATIRGFAWGTGSTLSGGDTATTTESGSFGTGAFSTTTLIFIGNTTYYSRAYATNPAGDGLGTISAPFLTLPDVPGTPTASAITATTLTVNWTAPAGGAVTYKVERCQGSGCSGFGQIASGGAGLSYNDSGLSASTVYRYRVRATNSSGDGLYATSADITTSATAAITLATYGFFATSTSYTPGSALAAQNTPVTLGYTGSDIRMRLLLGISTSDIAQSERAFKLQYATYSGSCGTYADVTGATPISYKTIGGLTDGTALGVQSDLTDGGNTIVNQTYESANNFTNSLSGINAGQDGEWDFSLYDNGAPGGQTYCLQVVNADGTPLTSYTNVPQLTTAVPPAPALSQYHYRWFYDNGTEGYATPINGMDSALTSTYVGDRRRLRIEFSNSGTGAATSYTYRLEMASTTCTTWYPVPNSPTSDPWTMQLSSYTSNGQPTYNYGWFTDPPGETFVPGYVMTTSNTTPAFTLPLSQFSIFVYSIASTATVLPNTTYCFRLTNAGSTTNFTYSVQPQATILPAVQRPDSGGASGNTDTSGSGGAASGGSSGDKTPPSDGGSGGGTPVGGGGSGGGGDSG